jgi:hypothetical protein
LQIHDALAWTDEKGNPVPRLAEKLFLSTL